MSGTKYSWQRTYRNVAQPSSLVTNLELWKWTAPSLQRVDGLPLKHFDIVRCQGHILGVKLLMPPFYLAAIPASGDPVSCSSTPRTSHRRTQQRQRDIMEHFSSVHTMWYCGAPASTASFSKASGCSTFARVMPLLGTSARATGGGGGLVSLSNLGYPRTLTDELSKQCP